MTETTTSEALEVNGERLPLTTRSIAGLLRERGIDPAGRGVAIALNGSVLPRAAWSGTVLSAGDVVEIVQAKQGG